MAAGYDPVRATSEWPSERPRPARACIETRRAMAAEVCEDKILQLAEELEDARVAGETEKCAELSASIDALKQQYSNLVGGGSSMFVDAVAVADKGAIPDSER